MILVALVWCIPVASAAQDLPKVNLTTPHTEWAAITPSLSFLRDTTRNLTLETAQTQSFTPLGRNTADFGYTKDVIWLKFEVTNQLETDAFVIAIRENFLQLYQVFLVTEDRTAQLIDDQNDHSMFSNRRVSYPELTTPLTLAPQQSGTVYIRFWSGGSSELLWRIMTRPAFDERSAHRTARNFIFYGMGILLASAAAMAWLTTRRAEFGAYSLYALAGLLYMMHADGNTFKYLWPNLPLFNAFASVLLGVFLITSGLNFARTFLNTARYHPSLDKVLVTLMGITFAVGASAILIDAQPIKRILILLALATTALLALSGLIAARTRFREVRFYLIAWGGAVISATLMTLRHWFGIEISEDLQYDSMRVVLILDAVLMGLAIIDRFNWLKQSQREALEVSLAQARKTVELNMRMQDLEHQIGIAERLAEQQQTRLTQTAHDIRQPLNALRLNLRGAMGEEADHETMTDVEDTLGYLENLVAQQLSTALSHDSDSTDDGTAPEQTSLGDVLASAVDMFEADATVKGLHLRAMPSSATCAVPPLDLMRMVTNLVSNAIKATRSGGIVVGIRRAGGLRIEVHDTGPGLPNALFKAAKASSDPLPSDTGTGLGLTIIAELAAKHSLRFERLRGDSRGTVLRLWLH